MGQVTPKNIKKTHFNLFFSDKIFERERRQILKNLSRIWNVSSANQFLNPKMESSTSFLVNNITYFVNHASEELKNVRFVNRISKL